MREQITTNIKVDPEVMEKFKSLAKQRDRKKGEAIGDLITADVKKNYKLIEGESK